MGCLGTLPSLITRLSLSDFLTLCFVRVLSYTLSDGDSGYALEARLPERTAWYQAMADASRYSHTITVTYPVTRETSTLAFGIFKFCSIYLSSVECYIWIVHWHLTKDIPKSSFRMICPLYTQLHVQAET